MLLLLSKGQREDRSRAQQAEGRLGRAAVSYLPDIDPNFAFVTDDLIKNVKSWLDFPWTTAIAQEDRDAFLAEYAQPPQRQPRRKRRRRRS